MKPTSRPALPVSVTHTDRRCPDPMPWEPAGTSACGQTAVSQTISDARQRLILDYLDLADALAWRFRGSSPDLSDLKQVARLGLVKAAKGYDPAKGNSFAAYAMPTIVGEVKRYLRDHGWMIRPPRPIQELRAAITTAKSELAFTLGREPTLTELADAVQVERRTAQEALQSEAAMRPASFQCPVSETDLRALAEILGGPDENLERIEELTALASALRELTAWERRLLFLRYFQERTQQQIADDLEISQMQVSRVLARLLQRLRAQLDGHEA